MITFKQQFTFSEESIKGFAIFLGWQEKITTYKTVEIEGEFGTQSIQVQEVIDNPQTFIEFVEERAKAHTMQFIKLWAENLKQEELNRQLSELKATVEPSLEEEIVKPVEVALVSEVVVGSEE